jgi:hypothetical protein
MLGAWILGVGQASCTECNTPVYPGKNNGSAVAARAPGEWPSFLIDALSALPRVLAERTPLLDSVDAYGMETTLWVPQRLHQDRVPPFHDVALQCLTVGTHAKEHCVDLISPLGVEPWGMQHRVHVVEGNASQQSVAIGVDKGLKALSFCPVKLGVLLIVIALDGQINLVALAVVGDELCAVQYSFRPGTLGIDTRRGGLYRQRRRRLSWKVTSR